MSKKDYYSILGIQKGATQDEIKKAFKKKALEHHPDRNHDKKDEAEKKIKEINEAYSVLGDEGKRRQYDQFGSVNEGGGGFYGGGGGFEFDINDIFGGFEDFFGGGRGSRKKSPKKQSESGSDLSYSIQISLEEACFGKTNETITFVSLNSCETCHGTGSKDGKTSECRKCNGSGAIRTQKGFFIMEQTCDACMGSGHTMVNPCSSCRGEGRVEGKKTVKFDIPAGIDTGMSIRISGKGDAGKKGGSSGDLYVKVSVKPHNVFERSADSIVCNVPIKFTTAILGGKIKIPTIDGKIEELEIKPGTQGDTVINLKNKGMTILNSGNRRGDMKINIKVEMPISINKRAKEILEELDKEISPESNPNSNSFFKKIKNIFQ